MSTLILVTCDSAAGHLKMERRADRVLAFTHRLVDGPVPTDGAPEAFFARQRALYEAEELFCEPYWFDAEDVDGTRPLLKRIWSRLPEVCRQHDRIELWIDPDPNAQLVMVQLLSWLGTLADIAPRLWLKQSDSPLGGRRPGDWALPPRPVEADDVMLAQRAWSSFGGATPQAWADLCDISDLDRLPGLRPAVTSLLCELPDRTGLGATERRTLSLVESQDWWLAAQRRGGDTSRHQLKDEDRTPPRIIHRVQQSGRRVPLWHFEIGEVLCRLATAPLPAVSGIVEPHFSLDLHGDEERFRRFRACTVRLTDFGRRLLDGVEDWTAHNPLHRWIGGTRLVNDHLWRWDEERLIAP